MLYACIARFKSLDHFFRGRSLSRSRTFVRLVAACLLGIHLMLVLGISVPVYPSKQVTERFPCEKCPCGCVTAAYCWDKCCCHTDEQKLAWAERNDVQPPEFLVLRVQAKSSTTIDLQASREEQPIGQAQPAPKSCCGCKTGKRSQPASDSSRQVVKVVLLDSALRCLGIKMALALYSDTWIPDLSTTVEPPHPICLGWLCTMDETCPSISLPVDGPVPRAV